MRWHLLAGIIALFLVVGSVNCQADDVDDFETDVSVP